MFLQMAFSSSLSLTSCLNPTQKPASLSLCFSRPMLSTWRIPSPHCSQPTFFFFFLLKFSFTYSSVSYLSQSLPPLCQTLWQMNLWEKELKPSNTYHAVEEVL